MTPPDEPHAPTVDQLGAGEPPAQEPTRPDVAARPDLQLPPQSPRFAPPVAPPPLGGYGQFPPPVPPAPKPRSTRTTLLVIAIVVLMAGGGAAGYLLVGGDDEGRTTASDATAEAEQSASPEEEAAAEPTEESRAFEFSDETIPIESLGAQMPLASDDWELAVGPGEDIDDFFDASSYYIQYEENWYANFMVGRYAVPDLPYSSEEAVDIAIELADYWAEQDALSGENGTRTEPSVTETTIGGRPAVIAESTASWDSSDLTSDAYERVTVILIDVDGVNALYGLSFIPESADAEYGSVMAAFEAITFE